MAPFPVPPGPECSPGVTAPKNPSNRCDWVRLGATRAFPSVISAFCFPNFCFAWRLCQRTRARLMPDARNFHCVSAFSLFAFASTILHSAFSIHHSLPTLPPSGKKSRYRVTKTPFLSQNVQIFMICAHGPRISAFQHFSFQRLFLEVSALGFPHFCFCSMSE